jgi:hypothetical protein
MPPTLVYRAATVHPLCTGVGIDETPAVSSFTVYPNPSSGELNISFKDPVDGILEIINTTGPNDLFRKLYPYLGEEN